MPESINIQREKIQKGNPKIELVDACRIDQGIKQLNDNELSESIQLFDSEKDEKSICFFIPASGSGSRMFGFLFDYLNNRSPKSEVITQVENLIQCIDDFAFYDLLDKKTVEELKTGELEVSGFIEKLLSEPPFEYASKPKGLIPFHRSENGVINPFQEHVLHGINIGGNHSKFHFTIKQRFEKEIDENLRKLDDIDENRWEFSVQDPGTNSVAFEENMTPLKDEEGNTVDRPAGHGALLYNLNTIDSDLIFIRNIDNIQHQNQQETSIRYRKALGGELLKAQKLIFRVLNKLDEGEKVDAEIEQLNKRYQFEIPSEIRNDPKQLHHYLNRPIRVCGVVKNEGQPGGGPFWVIDSEGYKSRQIVEKAQISNDPSQIDLILKSTHFNPVEIICGVKDYQGNKFDLLDYRNPDLYFIVHKNHEGTPVQYVEQPGLWNGGMEKWTTLFYEIDPECFSPVKTVLDLLEDEHQG